MRLDAQRKTRIWVRSASPEQGQLITRAIRAIALPAVEISFAELDLKRRPDYKATDFSATAGRADADSLAPRLNLPPAGAIPRFFRSRFGHSIGLTSWTFWICSAADFSPLAVFRLWGVDGRRVGFCGFGLGHHEPGAPRIFVADSSGAAGVAESRAQPAGPQWLIALKYIVVAGRVLDLRSLLAGEVQQVALSAARALPGGSALFVRLAMTASRHS